MRDCSGGRLGQKPVTRFMNNRESIVLRVNCGGSWLGCWPSYISMFNLIFFLESLRDKCTSKCFTNFRSYFFGVRAHSNIILNAFRGLGMRGERLYRVLLGNRLQVNRGVIS